MGERGSFFLDSEDATCSSTIPPSTVICRRLLLFILLLFLLPSPSSSQQTEESEKESKDRRDRACSHVGDISALFSLALACQPVQLSPGCLSSLIALSPNFLPFPFFPGNVLCGTCRDCNLTSFFLPVKISSLSHTHSLAPSPSLSVSSSLVPPCSSPSTVLLSLQYLPSSNTVFASFLPALWALIHCKS